MQYYNILLKTNSPILTSGRLIEFCEACCIFRLLASQVVSPVTAELNSTPARVAETFKMGILEKNRGGVHHL